MNESAKPDPEPKKPSEGARPRFRNSQRARVREPEKTNGSSRETIESVVIAFVLAFLFRTFEAEAFVIPTGSMAPTLMGEHLEVECAECGWVFTVGATSREEKCGAIIHGRNRDAGNDFQEPRCENILKIAATDAVVVCGSCGQEHHYDALTHCVCPNCELVNSIKNPVFKGDRILVLKALFDLPGWAPAWLREPKRWDVVVFKFPEEPQVNYIKRLVALPNEEVRIQYGNLFTRKPGDAEFQIARKPPEKQKVMRMLVFDNNHQPANWKKNGWPARWQSEASNGWRESDDGKSFQTNTDAGNQTDWTRLSYHHLIKKDWGDSRSSSAPPREQLITDFYAYNAGLSDGRYSDLPQPHWVSELNLCLTAEVMEAKGRMRLELAKAGDRFICEFDLSSGTCRLFKVAAGGSVEEVLATAQNGIRRAGRFTLGFADFDNRLTVWLDDKLLFGDGHDYEGAKLGEPQRPREADLRPASVAVQGTRLRLSDLVLYRDIYYTHTEHGSIGNEYAAFGADDEETWSNPSLWESFERAKIGEFVPLGPDEFMMLGDNSPRSKDGRLWDEGARRWISQIARERGLSPEELRREVAMKSGGEVVLSPENVVHRQLLIGKAFFVYWPHAVPFGPVQIDVPPDFLAKRLGKYRVPFYPNVSRMKRIQ